MRTPPELPSVLLLFVARAGMAVTRACMHTHTRIASACTQIRPLPATRRAETQRPRTSTCAGASVAAFGAVMSMEVASAGQEAAAAAANALGVRSGVQSKIHVMSICWLVRATSWPHALTAPKCHRSFPTVHVFIKKNCYNITKLYRTRRTYVRSHTCDAYIHASHCNYDQCQE